MRRGAFRTRAVSDQRDGGKSVDRFAWLEDGILEMRRLVQGILRDKEAVEFFKLGIGGGDHGVRSSVDLQLK